MELLFYFDFIFCVYVCVCGVFKYIFKKMKLCLVMILQPITNMITNPCFFVGTEQSQQCLIPQQYFCSLTLHSET